MSIFSNERQERIIKNLRYQVQSLQADLSSAIGEKSEFQIEKSRLNNEVALLKFKYELIDEENTALSRDLNKANEKNIDLRRQLEESRDESVTAVKLATADLQEEIDSLKEEMAGLRHENAGLSAKLDAQEAMIELAPEVQDIKDIVSKIIDKLPTINLSGITQTVSQGK